VKVKGRGLSTRVGKGEKKGDYILKLLKERREGTTYSKR
jgi:hypothetical protein